MTTAMQTTVGAALIALAWAPVASAQTAQPGESRLRAPVEEVQQRGPRSDGKAAQREQASDRAQGERTVEPVTSPPPAEQTRAHQGPVAARSGPVKVQDAGRDD